jgi:hypothetical protein
MIFDRMPQSHLLMDAISVPPTFTLDGQIAGFREVIDDPLHCALRDAHTLREVAHTGFRIFRNAEQNVRMVGEKGPGA